MRVGCRSVLVSEFAVFVSGGCVRLCVIMFADIVIMRRLMVMMRCSVVVSRGLMVMLTCGMLR